MVVRVMTSSRETVPSMFVVIAAFVLGFHTSLSAGASPVHGSASLAGPATGAASVSGCPRTCFCNSLSRIVYCSRRGLNSVPTTLPVATLQLNLNGNRFRSTGLLRTNFSSPTLETSSIEHLYLSDCGIETVEVGTFADLISLRWLDLSDNRLLVIPGRCFHGLTLQHLFLNGNRRLQLDPGAFDQLSVSGLYLHDCQLDDLPAATIAPLNGTLVNLWLNGNRLAAIDRRLSGLFAGLTHLRLGSNPLRCNCDTLWIKELYDSRGGATFRGAEQPTCARPTSVRGRHFGQLSVEDFRCRAPVIGNVDASFYPDAPRRDGAIGGSRGHIRCTASGEPTPTLYWVRPSGRTIRYEAASPMEAEAKDSASEKTAPQRLVDRSSHRQQHHGLGGIEEGRNEAVLELLSEDDGDAEGNHKRVPVETGMYICIAANDVGNVTLTVNLTWPTPVAHREQQTVDRHATWRPSLTASSSTQSTAAAARLAVINLDDVINAGNPDQSDGDLIAGGEGRYEPAGDDRFTPKVFPVSGARTFSATEMAIAIVGTHVATLLLLLAIATVTMPGCRHRLATRLTTRRHRQQHGIAEQPTGVARPRDMAHRTSRNYGGGALMAASTLRSAYDVEDSLLHSSVTPSRTVNESSYQSARDFSSTFGSRKYFWPPSTEGTANFES